MQTHQLHGKRTIEPVPEMLEGNVFILFVCLSVCSGYNFECIDIETSVMTDISRSTHTPEEIN